MHLSKWVVHKPVSYLNAVTAWREVDDVKLWEKYATKEAVRGSENRDAVDGCWTDTWKNHPTINEYVNRGELLKQGRIQGEGRSPRKTYESNFIYHDFAKFLKQHSRYKAFLAFIVLSQQRC